MDVVLSFIPLQMHEVVSFWPRGLHSLLDAARWPPEVLDAYFRPVISSGEAWEVSMTCRHLFVPVKTLVSDRMLLWMDNLQCQRLGSSLLSSRTDRSGCAPMCQPLPPRLAVCHAIGE